MRTKFYSILVGTSSVFILSLLLLLVGCSTAPTKFEQGVFNVQTNYTPVLVVKTNVIPVTIVQTNLLTVTNVLGVTEYKTNLVPILSYQTNTEIVTNMRPDYLFTPGEGAKNVKEVGTAVGNIFGVGGMVGTGLGALFSLWGYVRSKKSLVTAGNIAQTVETMREFIKSLPNGQVYDSELVNWMQTNQANAGVLNQVMALLSQQVDNRDAKEAARQVMETINALKNLSAPTAPKV